MANIFPYELKNTEDLVFDKPAVYKLYFGRKYFIFKGKYLKVSVEQNLTDINKILWSPKPGHIFMPVCDYIHKARPLKCKVEVCIQTEDPNLFLNVERQLLEDGRDDENCLNASFEPIIPKWLQEQLNEFKPPVKPLNKAVRDKIIPPPVHVPENVEIVAPVADSKRDINRVDKLVNAFKLINAAKKAKDI